MADYSTLTSIAGIETSLPNVNRGFYDKKLLRNAFDLLVYQKFADQHPLSQRKGQTMVLRRYTPHLQATTPLTEGVTPTGMSVAKVDVTIVVKPYGNYVGLTDAVNLTHYDNVLSVETGLMGENMGESLDSVVRDGFMAGTQFVTVTAHGASPAQDDSSAQSAVDSVITKSAVSYAIRQLEANKAKYFTPQVNATPGVSTMPIPKSFWCIIHPKQIHDIYTNSISGFTIGTDFIPVERYSAQMGIMEGEIGAFRNVRFIATTNCKVYTGTGGDSSEVCAETVTDKTDVYCNLVIGRNALGVVPLSGASGRTIIKPTGSGGTSDPLDQRATVGWKAYIASGILNDNWVTRIQCGTLA